MKTLNCPYADGPAVYTARAILRAMNTQRQEYRNECEKVYPASSANREAQKTLKSNKTIDQSTFSIFPNPANSTITLNHYSIYNKIVIEEISGKAVFETNINPNLSSEIFDVSSLANGIYIIKLISDTNASQAELIINK